MTPPKRCPGCDHPIPRTEPWCTPCHLRLPAQLQQDLTRAERALSALRAQALDWLGSHPHATERELEIIRLAATGLENQQIADELHLAVHTVRDHWRRLSKRWGCRNRTQVVATAFRLGYLCIEGGPEAKVARA